MSELASSTITTKTQSDLDLSAKAVRLPPSPVVAKMSAVFQSIREDLFQMDVPTYAKAMGIPRQNVKNSYERSNDAARPITVDGFLNIIKAWEQAAIADPAKAEPIANAKTELLKCIKKFYGDDAYGLLYSYAYQHGVEKFQKASGMDLRGIQNAKNFRQELNFKSLLDIAVNLSEDKPKTPKEVLAFAKEVGVYDCYMQESRRAGRPKQLAKLHAYVNCCGGQIKSQQGHAILGVVLTLDTQAQLRHFRFIAADKIDPILDELHKSKILSKSQLQSFKAEWAQEYEKQIPNCNVRLGQLAAERGLTAPFIAECLGIKEGARDGQSYLVARYFNGLSSAETLPFGVVAYLVANSPKEAEDLITDARKEFTDDLRRTKCAKAATAVFVERLVWGVKNTEVPGLTLPELSFIEKSDKYKPPLKRAKVIQSITEAGMAKIEVPFKRFLARTAGETVAEFYKTEVTKHGAVVTKDKFNTQKSNVAAFVSGADVPELKKLEKHSKAAGSTLSLTMLADWYDKFPKNLLVFNHNDASRVLMTHISTCSEDLRDLYRKTGANPEKSSRRITQINSAGWLEPAELRELLRDLQSTLNEYQKYFIKSVNDSGSIVNAVAQTINKFSQIPEFNDEQAAFIRTYRKSDTENKINLFARKFNEQGSEQKDQELALNFQKKFPGATIAEILNAIENGACDNLANDLTDLYKNSKFKPATIAFIAEATRNGATQIGISSFTKVIKEGRLTSLVSPHLMCILAAGDSDELKQLQEQTKCLIIARLEEAGVSNKLEQQADLIYYGIVPSRDINIERLAYVVAAAKKEDSEIASKLTRAVAIKTEIYSKQILACKLPKNVKVIMQVWRTSRSEDARTAMTAAGINSQIDSEYTNGKKVPMQPRLSRILSSTRLKYEDNFQLAWQFDYADWMVARSLPVLARMLYTETAAGEYLNADRSKILKTPEKFKLESTTLERSVLHELADEARVNKAQSAMYLSKLEKTEVPDAERLDLLHSYLDYALATERRQILQAVRAANADVVKGITALIKSHEAPALNNFDAWNEIITIMAQNNPDLAKSLSIKQIPTLDLKTYKISKAAKDLASLLYGSTREEVIDLYISNFAAEHLVKIPAFTAKLDFLARTTHLITDMNSLKAGFEERGFQAFWTVNLAGIDALQATRYFHDPVTALDRMSDRLLNSKVHRGGQRLSETLLALRQSSKRPLDVNILDQLLT